MPRFAILTHDHPFLHWDFLLECGSSCRTWRLLHKPEGLGKIPAESLPEHRLMYLDYEGPVSGDRGGVTAWDTGTFEWMKERSDFVEVRLIGQKLTGIVRLVQINETSWIWESHS